MNNRVLKDFIVCLSPDFGDCGDQGYDEAQIFQGHVKGVAKRFKDNSVATSVHCLAHCINFCLQEVIRSCKCSNLIIYKCYIFYFSWGLKYRKCPC